MNQLQYKHVIETVLVPFIDSLDGEDNPRMFMQHGAPCLTAKSVLSAFRDFGIPLLPWPGNSPDLNPIDNVWSVLKSIVYASPNPTVAILKANIQKVWTEHSRLHAKVDRSCHSS